ncbi:DUF4342 domain-containing protein [Dethiothermospora halolimnae]|uniref:DUF4342 domain-containing protein n=1 Tax=Dethiothermospora halolimnae TaxID=3114390 RepID=UPI003CCBA5C2
MEITLEKIDQIRERTGVSYKEAKEVLERHNGDVLEALIELEASHKSFGQNISSKGDVVLQKIKEMIKKGNVTKILVKKDGDIIMNIPVTAGALGTILAPPLAAFGLTAALVSRSTIEIVKEDGEIVNVNDMAERTMDKMKNTVKKEDKDDTNEDDNM